MDFKKKFDHNDITNFLPDNLTIGTSNYFSKKYNLPSYMCEMLEIKSRREYNDNEKNLLNEIREKQREFDLKLLNEFSERSEESAIQTATPGENEDETLVRLEDAK